MTAPDTARDEGIAAAEHAADPRVILAVDAVIQRWIDSGRRFSANDIRDEMPAAAKGIVGPRLRAASMRRPQQLAPVDEVQSNLTSTHAKKIIVWQRADLAGSDAA